MDMAVAEIKLATPTSGKDIISAFNRIVGEKAVVERSPGCKKATCFNVGIQSKERSEVISLRVWAPGIFETSAVSSTKLYSKIVLVASMGLSWPLAMVENQVWNQRQANKTVKTLAKTFKKQLG